LDASEGLVDRPGWGFEPGEAATLGDRSAREDRVQMLEAALGMKALLERVVQAAHVWLLVGGEEALQGADNLPVVVS
jgi:hypothetical protein